jgi:hypothetical protein
MITLSLSTKDLSGRGPLMGRPLSWTARLQAVERAVTLPALQTGSDCRQGRAR